MPATCTFAFTRTEPKRLEIRDKLDSLWVLFDGTELARFERRELNTARTVPLSDGSELSIVYLGKLAGGWMVARNGQPLPGTAGDRDYRRVREASNVFALIGVLSLALSLMLLATKHSLPDVGSGVGLLIEACVYFGLFLGTRMASVVALAAGATLFTIETVVSLAVFPRSIWVLASLLIRAGMGLLVFRGLLAGMELRRERRRKGGFHSLMFLESLPRGSKLFDD